MLFTDSGILSEPNLLGHNATETQHAVSVEKGQCIMPGVGDYKPWAPA